MTSAVSEPLRRLVPARQRIGRLLRSAAFKALIGCTHHRRSDHSGSRLRVAATLRAPDLRCLAGCVGPVTSRAPGSFSFGGTETDCRGLRLAVEGWRARRLAGADRRLEARIIGCRHISRQAQAARHGNGSPRFSPGTRKSFGPSSSRRVRSRRSCPRKPYAAQTVLFSPMSCPTRETWSGAVCCTPMTVSTITPVWDGPGPGLSRFR